MSAALALVCPHCDHEVVELAQFCHLCGAELPISEERPRPLEYGSLWKRLAAVFIDAGLVTILVVPTCLFFAWMLEILSDAKMIGREDARFTAGMSTVVFFLVVDWVYHARLMSTRRQATFGKRWMGLRVTDMAGGPISFGQATGRHFAKFLSTFALLVGFIIAIFSKRRQALHDMVAGTLVLKSVRSKNRVLSIRQ